MSHAFQIVLLLQLVVGSLLPLLVGLVTTRVTGSHKKALLLLALSLLTAFLTDLIASLNSGVRLDVVTWLLLALPSYVTAVATHFGLWKPTGATETAQASLVKQPRNADGTFA